ncbi:hypothetical protein PR048_029958 [Dryococelus australis]|uniref:DUF4817 domain-containing protein n=1 Tax=Dryococelus australis TaxID=614101 RepID=A0ABQ9G8G1_9NEOP|nr:hypothetical protein PR048_029958 [Dryococelus australis]
MADQSPLTLEERIITAVWVHERPHSGKTLREVFRDFLNIFDKVPPTKATVLSWERKLFATGNMKNSPRSGRPKTRNSSSDETLASVERSPKTSVRKRSSEIGVPKSSLHRHLREDIQLDP